MNKREDFRIPMFDEQCTAKSIAYSTQGKMENLSGTGMALITASDFFQTDIEMHFLVGEKEFSRKGIIVKRESLPSGEVKYRVRFVEFTDRERSELHSALVTLEASRTVGDN